MKIWVDADACPVLIKNILFKAANRTRVKLILVANQALHTPPSAYISMLQVNSGFDAADNEIVKQLSKGDLVITSDIPLAAQVVSKSATALNPRGELYTAENIRECLNMRDFAESLRSNGIDTGGQSTFSKRDLHAFSNQLDKYLSKHHP